MRRALINMKKFLAPIIILLVLLAIIILFFTLSNNKSTEDKLRNTSNVTYQEASQEFLEKGFRDVGGSLVLSESNNETFYRFSAHLYENHSSRELVYIITGLEAFNDEERVYGILNNVYGGCNYTENGIGVSAFAKLAYDINKSVSDTEILKAWIVDEKEQKLKEVSTDMVVCYDLGV